MELNVNGVTLKNFLNRLMNLIPLLPSDLPDIEVKVEDGYVFKYSKTREVTDISLQKGDWGVGACDGSRYGKLCCIDGNWVTNMSGYADALAKTSRERQFEVLDRVSRLEKVVDCIVKNNTELAAKRDRAIKAANKGYANGIVRALEPNRRVGLSARRP